MGCVLSHSDHSSCSQYQHFPQPRNEGTTTRSPGLRSRVCGPDLDDLAHVLVPDDVALAHGRDVAAEQMQIRPARGRQPDLEDRVVWIDDLRVRDRLDLQVVDAHPAERPHDDPFPAFDAAARVVRRGRDLAGLGERLEPADRLAGEQPGRGAGHGGLELQVERHRRAPVAVHLPERERRVAHRQCLRGRRRGRRRRPTGDGPRPDRCGSAATAGPPPRPGGPSPRSRAPCGDGLHRVGELWVHRDSDGGTSGHVGTSRAGPAQSPGEPARRPGVRDWTKRRRAAHPPAPEPAPTSSAASASEAPRTVSTCSRWTPTAHSASRCTSASCVSSDILATISQ